ncbi:hypothetical protein NDU88_006705 [Pleurodeles waltl]|uniref:ribonuclease H n=1 Tax=Pleurodeles waltl TaxID=8319 RepID=A0AAV7TYD1_PLEWA|nr:hypothetical protein NDU88_006705 [Pleurodeles waltl]
MHLPNAAIKREWHLTPTIDDILGELSESRWFSKLDLRSGYHQLVLAKESRYITTFSTHIGLRRSKRLSFGVSSAAEVFQNVIQELLADLPGTINVSDDILIPAPTMAEHHVRLQSVLQRIQDAGITLHRRKCEFLKDRIQFFGYIFSANGVDPDPAKVNDIRSAPPPNSVTEVRSFLGMVNFCGRFIKDLSNLSQPLRRLTKNSESWDWGPDEQKAFEAIKEALSSETTLRYFDPQKNTKIAVDAGPKGLGAVLLQEQLGGVWSPVAYASRSLTDTEQRYSEIEKEAIAVHWGCKHYHIYVYGRPFVVTTDHKPLLPLFNGTASKPPPRIEKWMLQLQDYRCRLEYHPGAENPADYLSCHPRTASESEMSDARETEEYVRYVIDRSRPLPMSIAEIVQATSEDECLQKALMAVRPNKWHSVMKQVPLLDSESQRILKSLFHVRDELTMDEEGCLLRGTRLVLPSSLTGKAVELAHNGHQGRESGEIVHMVSGYRRITKACTH